MSGQDRTERYEELLAGFVLGTLTRRELDEFHTLRDEGLSGDAISIDEAHELLAELPGGLQTTSPSPRVKERIMRQIRSSNVVPIRDSTFDIRHSSGRIPALAWAAILILALINLGMFVQTLRLNDDFSRIADQNTKLKESLTGVTDELTQQKTVNAMLTNPDVQVAHLKATKTPCVARMYYDPVARLVLVCTQSLPDLEPGKDYQLWALVNGKPVSVGLLQTGQDGVYKVEVGPSVPMNKNPAYAISREPKGGQPQPTGEIVFASL